tara:strand:- start:334 stop:525 length:192 start_codon:yes stop_codon:yes gene_type:complete
MALTDHSTIWAQASNNNVNTTVHLTQLQLNRFTASRLDQWSSDGEQHSGHTNTKSQGIRSQSQ